MPIVITYYIRTYPEQRKIYICALEDGCSKETNEQNIIMSSRHNQNRSIEEQQLKRCNRTRQ